MRLGLNSFRIFWADSWQSLWTCRGVSHSGPTFQPLGGETNLVVGDVLALHHSVCRYPIWRSGCIFFILSRR